MGLEFNGIPLPPRRLAAVSRRVAEVSMQVLHNGTGVVGSGRCAAVSCSS